MKAMRYHEYGDVGVLRYEDADRPTPGAGQVLVQVASTSFNPVDVGIRAGYLQQVFPVSFPHTPGIDVAGTVAEVGRESRACRSVTRSSGSCRWMRTAPQPTSCSHRPRC